MHRAARLQNSDLQRRRQGVPADRQRVALQDLRLEAGGELFDQAGIVAVVHRNRDLGFELRQDFSGDRDARHP